MKKFIFFALTAVFMLIVSNLTINSLGMASTGNEIKNTDMAGYAPAVINEIHEMTEDNLNFIPVGTGKIVATIQSTIINNNNDNATKVDLDSPTVKTDYEFELIIKRVGFDSINQFETVNPNSFRGYWPITS